MDTRPNGVTPGQWSGDRCKGDGILISTRRPRLFDMPKLRWTLNTRIRQQALFLFVLSFLAIGGSVEQGLNVWRALRELTGCSQVLLRVITLFRIQIPRMEWSRLIKKNSKIKIRHQTVWSLDHPRKREHTPSPSLVLGQSTKLIKIGIIKMGIILHNHFSLGTDPPVTQQSPFPSRDQFLFLGLDGIFAYTTYLAMHSLSHHLIADCLPPSFPDPSSPPGFCRRSMAPSPDGLRWQPS